MIRRIYVGTFAAALYIVVTLAMFLYGGLGMDHKLAWFLTNVWLQPGAALEALGHRPWGGLALAFNAILVGVVAGRLCRRG